MNAVNYIETIDGANIYYEDQGNGRPIILIHGWQCSSKFWQKNIPELANEFRVVAIDLRGHGNSSKTLTGHTVGQYARDVRQLIEHLGLEDAALVGWSMGGSVVLSYYQQYAQDSRLKALGLVDTSPFPFSPADWNNHALRNYNFDGMHKTFAAYIADPRKFAVDFTNRMFKQKPSDSGIGWVVDIGWVVAEMMKIPPWIAVAIYSDFVMSDLARILPSVQLPIIVCAGDSGVFPNGIAMGKALAGRTLHGKFIPFEDGGHILFYEQPKKFNAALAGFIKAL